MNILEFNNVWEVFRIKFIVEGKPSWDNIWALKDINFKLKKGEALGVIGENGAGKTTLLKLIAGILEPDRGNICVKGKVAGLLELGAGFEPELTGKDNIYLNCSMFGLSRGDIDLLYEDIVGFASLGRFINAQVKCYSQGMFVRLAFAIAAHINPDIFLIDDTLAVGDEFFQKKCLKKIFEIKEKGTTFVFVTHDMNMLRRLCDQVIFLKKGRIIKDGLAEGVVPLYTQMVGFGKEVSVLKRSPLTVVFNGGRLFINWHDHLITPSSGLYTTFHILDKWYSSLQADWRVEEVGKNILIVRGEFYQLELTQIWRIEITANCEIKLDIEMECSSSLDIQQGYLNIMLSADYGRWFTTIEEGDFPSISEADRNWVPLLGNDGLEENMGIERMDSSDKIVPSLVFQYLNTPFSCYSQVLNGDYFSNCRILQCKIIGLQNYSKDYGRFFPYFSGKIILGDFSAKNYLERLQDDFTLKNGKSKLIFNGGKCAALSGDKPLTKAEHIFAMVYVNGRGYSSKTAKWDIKKETGNLIVARGQWSGLPLTQVWWIERKGNNSFSLKVYLEIKETVDIPRQYLGFECSQDYNYYYSDYGRGKFSETALNSESDMLQRCIPDGKIFFQGGIGDIAGLSVGFSKNSGTFAKVFNSDISTQARIMRIYRIEAEDNIEFLAGEYLCFDAKISLGQDKKINNLGVNSIKTLQRERLKFVFDDGRGRIYWNKQELTKKLSLYTSLRSLGRWHDSYSSAIWDIKGEGNAIECVGRWMFLPLRQIWRLKLGKDNSIMLEILLFIDKDVELDRLQTNLMLTEKYKEWLIGKDRGFFPSFNGDIDDDWQVISSSRNNAGGFSVIGISNNTADKDYLPGVKFLAQKIGSDHQLNILNSDLYHRGRILQYLSKDKIILSRGEYPYFKGEISIQGDMDEH